MVLACSLAYHTLSHNSQAYNSQEQTHAPACYTVMTTSGRIAVAPCGHTGETIIGTYVKCLQGCEGAAAVSGRGEPGHVLNCACKPCQIRRLTKEVVLRTKDGKDLVRLPWDGVSKDLRFTPGKSGYVMHYHFVDNDGKIIARGNLDKYLDAGVEAIARPKFMMDKISMVVERSYEGVKDAVKKYITMTFVNPGNVGFGGAWVFDPADIDPPATPAPATCSGTVTVAAQIQNAINVVGDTIKPSKTYDLKTLRYFPYDRNLK